MKHLQLSEQSYSIGHGSALKKRSDRLMNYFLAAFFIMGLLLAPFYDTWGIAIGVGACCLAAFYITRALLPRSDLYQYVLALVFGIFMAQFIFQMHGMFEMHFFAFIASAILITYQNWRLQIPLTIFVLVHHATLGYLQDSGVEGVYFTQLNSLELTTFIIHILLAAVIFFICGLWAFQFKKYSRMQLNQVSKMAKLERDAQLNEAKLLNEQVLKDAYQKAEKAREEADRANKAKTVFLATMSHEIRTPINGVIGMTSLLLNTKLTAEQNEYAKTISNCGDGLLSVINDILDFSKIESDKLELEMRDFDLRTCIENVFDIFAGTAGLAEIDLKYEIDQKVPAQIVGDSFRLRQVLLNLVGNAIKFTTRGEIFVGVSLQSTNENGQMELSFEVRDTGIGIPADKIHQLFEAFSQVDSSTTRKYGGSGLGLAICTKLVALMGGHISVKSVENECTTFTFTIASFASLKPVHAGIAEDKTGMDDKRVLMIENNLPAANNLPVVQSLSVDFAAAHPLRILLAEDNTVNQLLALRILSKLGLEADLAKNGREAVEMASRQQYDIILMDIQMPEMDGLQATRQLRKIKEIHPIIIAMTANVMKQDMDDCLEAGMEDFISKPAKPEAIVQALTKWSGTIRNQRRLEQRLVVNDIN